MTLGVLPEVALANAPSAAERLLPRPGHGESA